jgi:hypothetical protein
MSTQWQNVVDTVLEGFFKMELVGAVTTTALHDRSTVLHTEVYLPGEEAIYTSQLVANLIAANFIAIKKPGLRHLLFVSADTGDCITLRTSSCDAVLSLTVQREERKTNG